MERISYFVSWKCNDLFGNTPVDVYYNVSNQYRAIDKFNGIEKELKKILIKNSDIEENDYIKILNINII